MEIAKDDHDVLCRKHVADAIVENQQEINEAKDDDDAKMHLVVIEYDLSTRKRRPKKKVFKIDGIQSTCCITYNRNSESVVNNIYPDVDRCKGIPCPIDNSTVCKVARSSLYSTKYKNFEDADAKIDVIERQKKKVEGWLKTKCCW